MGAVGNFLQARAARPVLLAVQDAAVTGRTLLEAQHALALSVVSLGLCLGLGLSWLRQRRGSGSEPLQPRFAPAPDLVKSLLGFGGRGMGGSRFGSTSPLCLWAVTFRSH